ncbi:MAG: hypothetical protein II652_05930 [Bacteroidales bacterium]|nr:hypothetical protein [Bacteroidales bacterium]MBQ4298798.1 hypothetical protein [Bacteroidales bacterium]
MNFRKAFLASVLLLALCSCGTTRHSSGIKISDIPEFAFVQPYAYMVLYEDNAAGYYNQASSEKASNVIVSVINSERFPFSDMIPADYSGDNSDIAQWAGNLTSIKSSQVDRLRVPKSLVSLVNESGHRYGLLVYSYGYTMTEKAYQKERLQKTTSKLIDTAAEKLTGISNLTNPSGSYFPSDPYGNLMACVVIDAQEQRVVYYSKHTPTFASHPKDYEDVSKMLHKLLKDFK